MKKFIASRSGNGPIHVTFYRGTKIIGSKIIKVKRKKSKQL